LREVVNVERGKRSDNERRRQQDRGLMLLKGDADERSGNRDAEILGIGAERSQPRHDPLDHIEMADTGRDQFAKGRILSCHEKRMA
jgi:hypothetical protein